MSNLVTNLCRPLRLQPVRKCVLMALADRANDEGVAWPSLAWLCEWTCFSRRAVWNALEDLGTTGFVHINKIPGKNTRCEFVLDKLREAAENPGTTCTPTHAPDAPGDARRAPDTDVEPAANGGTTCTSAPDAPMHDVHPHPGTTCTPTHAPDAPGDARRAPDTSIDTLKTSEKTNTLCTEPPSGVDAEAVELVALIPLVNGEDHQVTAADVAEWAQAFPGVDVRAAVLQARIWCKDNPTKRKTARGVRRFLTGWIGREQDRGGRRPSTSTQASRPTALPEWCRDAGFENLDEAHNAMCWAHTAHLFRDGKRIPQEVAA